MKNNNYKKQNNSSEKTVKHSGATMHSSFTDKVTGEIVAQNFITAWNYAPSRGMMSIIASPRIDASKRKTKNELYENWAVKIFNKRTLQTTWTNGLFHRVKGIIILKDMQLVINPRAKNGGYFGTFVKS